MLAKNLIYRINYFSLIFLLIFLSITTLCSAFEHSKDKDTEKIFARASAYWNARIKHDYAKLYELEGEINKKRYDFSDYVKLYGDKIKIVKFNIDDIVIDSKKKKAKVRVNYQIELNIPVPGLLGYKRYVPCDDMWRFENKNWYHIQMNIIK